MVDRQSVVAQTQAFVREHLTGESSGHDWWHVHRVWRTAIAIGGEEAADRFVVPLGFYMYPLSIASRAVE